MSENLEKILISELRNIAGAVIRLDTTTRSMRDTIQKASVDVEVGAMSELIKSIRLLKNEWISVKTRRPNTAREVLVLARSVDNPKVLVRFLAKYKNGRWWETSMGYPIYAGAGHFQYRVAYWQEVPAFIE